MKKCFVCGIEKDLGEFYNHPRMSDGKLGKCKSCCKTQSKADFYRKSKDPEFVEKEKERGKDKYHRLNYKDRQRELDKDRPWKSGLYKNLHRNLNIPKGIEIHHWNYNLIDDYFLLSHKDHKRLHTFIEFDKESLMFKIKGTDIKLDKDSHRKLIEDNNLTLINF